MSTRTRKPRHPLLTAVRDRRDATREADLASVVSVVHWAAAHPDPDPACEDNPLGPTALALAGPHPGGALPVAVVLGTRRGR